MYKRHRVPEAERIDNRMAAGRRTYSCKKRVGRRRISRPTAVTCEERMERTVLLPFYSDGHLDDRTKNDQHITLVCEVRDCVKAADDPQDVAAISSRVVIMKG